MDCFIQTNEKMQAAVKFIYFFNILCYLSDYIQ